jgi:hypothetical protein
LIPAVAPRKAAAVLFFNPAPAAGRLDWRQIDSVAKFDGIAPGRNFFDEMWIGARECIRAQVIERSSLRHGDFSLEFEWRELPLRIFCHWSLSRVRLHEDARSAKNGKLSVWNWLELVGIGWNSISEATTAPTRQSTS